MMTYYSGNETGGNPGAFPDKWWEGSALMLGLLNYWHFTGDDYYNEELGAGLVHQGGEDENYLPSNYSHFLVSDLCRRETLTTGMQKKFEAVY